MSEGEPDTGKAIADLEQFVVENDELFQLEERIGRFNIFDALRIADQEIRHSNYLAWLLDPAESHGQGGLFLRSILMDLLRRSTPTQRPRGLSPIALDGGELRGVTIDREWRNIDLLVRCAEPPFVIAIENKVYSGEHSNQLERYKLTVREHFGDVPRQFVFLSPEGDAPSDSDWTVYSYRAVYETLRRVVDANRTAIGDDVLAFLDHYLRLIGSRFMDDPKVVELCRTIYKNHRNAIDLINQHVALPGRDLAASIEELLRDDGRWTIVMRTRQGCVYFGHRKLIGILPPINEVGSAYRDVPDGNRFWIYHSVTPTASGLKFTTGARPVTDYDRRRVALERITRDADEFGFRRRRKTLDAAWPTLQASTWMRWEPHEIPAFEDAKPTIEKRLDALDEKMKRVMAAIEEIRP